MGRSHHTSHSESQQNECDNWKCRMREKTHFVFGNALVKSIKHVFVKQMQIDSYNFLRMIDVGEQQW